MRILTTWKKSMEHLTKIQWRQDRMDHKWTGDKYQDKFLDKMIQRMIEIFELRS